jgi:hypothetical protein
VSFKWTNIVDKSFEVRKQKVTNHILSLLDLQNVFFFKLKVMHLMLALALFLAILWQGILYHHLHFRPLMSICTSKTIYAIFLS